MNLFEDLVDVGRAAMQYHQPQEQRPATKKSELTKSLSWSFSSSSSRRQKLSRRSSSLQSIS
jgi:hypothetical protein